MAKLRPVLVQDTRIRGGVTASRQVLTGLDVFHGHIFMPVVLIYNKGFDIEQAQRGLREALRLHPLVAGRLKRGKDGHTYVDGDDSGVVFRVYRCEGDLPYGPHRPVGKDVRLFSKTLMPWQIVNRDMSVILLELYRFDCGGILMVCSGLHSFFDGASQSGFLRNWSKACLGQAVEPPASFDRSVMIQAGSRLPDGSAHALMIKPRLLEHVCIVSSMIWRAATALHSEVFRIPAHVIQHWRAQAKMDLPEGAGVSASQLATAYILKAISPELPRGVERSVGLVLDLRVKRRLGLPRDYFGNALCWSEVRYSAEALAQCSLAALADRCKPPAEQLSVAALLKLLAMTEAHRQRKRLFRLMFRPVIETLRAGLIQNNMSKLPIYAIDLGGGGPDWFDIAPMTIRMAVLVATPEQDGGLDVHLTARRSEHKALRARLRADGIA